MSFLSEKEISKHVFQNYLNCTCWEKSSR